MDAGRAYHHQALELVMLCRLFVDVCPQEAQHDALLKEAMLAADEALSSATEAGEKLTRIAFTAFIEAEWRLSQYERSANPRYSITDLFPRMAMARQIDKQSRDRLYRDRHRGGLYTDQLPYDNPNVPAIRVNFVLLQSPLADLHGPDTITVPQLLSPQPTAGEILWNFARLEGRARVTLQQNPHFYMGLPAHEGAFGPGFSKDSLWDFVLRSNDTVYVLVDRPSRVFLKTGHKNRTFGNVWMLNGTLIFKDLRGRLEGEQLVRRDIFGRTRWYCEPLVVFPGFHAPLNRSCIPAITTTPSTNPAAGTTFKDWAFLSRPTLDFFNIHISDERWSPPVSTEGMVCLSALGRPNDSATRTLTLDPPSPPTSERPWYPVLYTTTDMLNDDVLLGVFNYYRLDNEINWNTQLGWRKLSHVCRRWRFLIHGSATHLDMHILCTNGTPLVNTLVHLPPLPLVIDYRYATATVGLQDELGIFHALRLCDRVRRVVLRIPPSILDQLLVLMDESFPVLEHLSLSYTAEEDTMLLLPKTFLAPNLHHLTLLGIGLPKKLLLLSSTLSLVTLTLANIRAPGYFLPRHLVTRLNSLSQLEELTIGFSIPLPRPSAERELLHELEAPVTLSVLKRLTFRGVSAYLDSFVAQIRAPLLEQFNITLFNQIAFSLPHLSHFTNSTERLKLPVAKVFFEHDAFSVVTHHHRQQLDDGPEDGTPSFSLRVICKQFDWQIDCAAQICSALMTSTLAGIEQLTLDVEGREVSTEWQDDAVDGATWRELLGSFTAAKELHICAALVWELSCALRPGDVGLDPGLLPCLEVLAPELEEEHAGNAFASFIDARQVAGRPVLLSPSPVPREQSIAFPQQRPETNPVSYPPPPSNRQGWLRRTVINPIRNRLDRSPSGLPQSPV
ncbi:hypothetical protein BJY52DRAFT_607568 [Lactarius psammicola]|nr:hypothetical protein BJY52DRAFT_607568 [Lactarius psammicola]